MLLGLLLCGVGVIAWLVMLELGQRIHDKSSLHRAADAAAYSAAVLQARALNMHAYLNRAQLAHQIAMAHLIGAATASRFRSTLSQQAQRRNPPPSLMGAFFGPQYSTAYLAAISGGVTHQFSQHIFRDSFMRHERMVHHVLGQVRQLQLQQLEQQQRIAVIQVLVRNVGQNGSAMKGDTLGSLGLSVQIPLNETVGFVVQKSANDPFWRNFLTSLVSQYSFLDKREKVVRNPWFIHPRCPLKRPELRRRGYLELSAEGQWRAQETQSFHALRHNRMIGCYHREYPMGWAAMATQKGKQNLLPDTNSATDFSRRPFWKWARAQGGAAFNIFSGRANPLAERWSDRAALNWSSKGLGQYAQIAVGREAEPVRFALTVQQRVSADASITSAATAQAYFVAPSGANGAAPNAARASLFEPYWRATLIPNIKTLKETSSKRLNLSGRVTP